jgi:hypothetical protein
MEKHYFPERFGFLPFGTPFENRDHVMHERWVNEPAQPNGENLPAGSYLATCKGCALQVSTAGLPELKCTHCRGLGREKQRVESTLSVSECNADEWIGNNNGDLICEMAPVPPPAPTGADTAADGGADDQSEGSEGAAREGSGNRDEL